MARLFLVLVSAFVFVVCFAGVVVWLCLLCFGLCLVCCGICVWLFVFVVVG